MRKINFATGEYYHIFNRGVDKRDIFLDEYDFVRFLQSTEAFNSIDPIGSLHELSFHIKNKSQLGIRDAKLVDIVTYCLNPNHYHFILRQKVEDGISKFMLKQGGGYANYFNNKYQRSGALFQGRFKAVHIDSNEYLLHLSAYVNLNNYVHKIHNAKSFRSSWETYIRVSANLDFIKNNIVLKQFPSKNSYKHFAESSLRDILENKDKLKDLESSVGE